MDLRVLCSVPTMLKRYSSCVVMLQSIPRKVCSTLLKRHMPATPRQACCRMLDSVTVRMQGFEKELSDVLVRLLRSLGRVSLMF